MQIEIYLICVFFFVLWLLVWWLTIITIAIYSKNIIIENWPDFFLLFSDIHFTGSYVLSARWNFEFSYRLWCQCYSSLDWICESFEYNSTSIHIYMHIVAMESQRWIKHKWTRECHKNQSLVTTRTYAVFAWRIFFPLSTFDFDHLHIFHICQSVNCRKETKNHSILILVFLRDAGAKRTKWLGWYWYGQREGACINKLKKKVK